MPQYDPSTGESAGVNSPVLYELLRQGRSFSGHERHCLFLNTGHQRFANISAASGFDFPDDGRSLSLVDWDLDGDLDLWLVNRNGPQVRFLKNDLSPGHHYVAIRLEGTRCNRDAVGARVEMILDEPARTKLVRTLHVGDGYMAQSSKWLHFGVGKATQVQSLLVRWPGGDQEQFLPVDATKLDVDRRYLLVQGTAKASQQNSSRRRVDLKSSPVALPPSTDVAHVLMVYPAPLPQLEYRSLDNRPVIIQNQLPRPTFLSLWASWCQPCVIELQKFANRKNDFETAGVDVLALSVDGLRDDDSSEPETAGQILSNLGFPFASGKASAQLVGRLQMVHDVLFDFHGPLPLPTSVLIDTQRQLVAIYKGPVEVDRVLTDAKRIGLDRTALRVASLNFAGRWHGRQPGHRFLRVAANLHEEGHTEDAGEFLLENERYFGHSPIYADLAVKVGVSLIGKGRLQEAQRLLRGAHRAKPDSAGTCFYLAQTLEQMGQDKEAARQYANVIELNPRSAMAHFRFGLLLAKQGDLDSAVQQFLEAARLKPRWAAPHFKLTVARLQQDQPNEALKHLRKTIRLKPVDPLTQTQLAWMLATHSDPRFRNGKQAVQWAETVCQSNGDKAPMALDALAAAYAEVGQFEEAVRTAKQAVLFSRLAMKQRVTDAIENRLRLYENRRPYRQRR